MAKISANDIRLGGLIEHKGNLWRVLKKSHVKPGKGGAFVQCELKDIINGTKLNERFRSTDKVEKPHVEPRKMQYLYACLLYTSPSPRDLSTSRMPSSA